MTETTKTIFEKYEIRKSKQQKTEFIEYVKSLADMAGYEVKTEKGMLGARNIVIGDPESAKVIYTAHYDTCATLPFPNLITPKNIGLYLLYQIAIVLAVFAIVFIITFLSSFIVPAPFLTLVYELSVLVLLGFFVFGPANKHTANDNTSGVTVVIDTMLSMPENAKKDAAFVLFDLEEMGLFGSCGYNSKHKTMMKNKLLINFDCVSDGNDILLIVKKKASDYIPAITEAFKGNETICTQVVSKNVFYPSDQSSFPMGVGIGAFKRTKRLKILYLDRIHTKHDTIYNEENISFLVNSAIKLTEIL
ncbi:MAG: M28 family peptidase [Clostridia bacterium]|nr:M28 family peptidase [Clostridia bacterium]MEE1025107.1 M28 family peptidase [Acutalibacteraceae bacterium]